MESSERNLIIGKGQIGSALYETFLGKKSVLIRDIDSPEYADIDILHVAFPYSETFIADVKDYIEQYRPILTIVYSTLPIGTCERIDTNIVHSPIEGRHPNLKESIKIGVRWVGCEDRKARIKAVKFWRPLVKTVRTMDSSRFTEFLKLRSTARYGVNLVWADYEASVAEVIGMEFEALQFFDQDYNELYKDLGMPQFQRYILNSPNGKIGGHCVVENADLLSKQFPHPMLELIKNMRSK